MTDQHVPKLVKPPSLLQRFAQINPRDGWITILVGLYFVVSSITTPNTDRMLLGLVMMLLGDLRIAQAATNAYIRANRS